MHYEVLLHSHRLAIAMALSENAATVNQLRRKLPHIPQASVYRAVQKLEDAGIIIRVAENQARGGVVEPLYRLAVSISGLPTAGWDIDQYMQAAFAVFFTIVMGGIESLRDDRKALQQARFNAMPLYLSEEDRTLFTEDVRELLKKYGTPSPDRRPYSLATFLLPKGVE